ncbi:YveK family protein [Enterococcus sp. AZ109]|uniref:YveK family protein n=1 Tax=Enterococcus sp. AZ109 TaxID=2774634 RepID=UPI003F23594D
MYTFRDFLFFLWQRKIAVLLLTIGAMFVVSSGFIYIGGFRYTSQLSFLLPVTEEKADATEEDRDEQEVENQVIASNIKLVETYKEMVKSDSVFQAMQAADPTLTKEMFTKTVRVNSSINSQIFTVEVTATSPEQSQKIAENLGACYPQQVVDSQLPRDVYVITTPASIPLRTPSVQKILFSSLIISLIFATSCSFLWVSSRERRILCTPEAAADDVGVEVIGVVTFYK